MFIKHTITYTILYIKILDLIQSHRNIVLFIARWFVAFETCPTDHRVKGKRVSPPWLTLVKDYRGQ